MDSLRRALAAIPILARGLVTSIAGNISLALLSVALGFTLWLFVTDREHPKQVEAFNSSLPISFVNVPTDLAVANASESSVRIRIEGSESDLSSLTTEDFDATVNLGGLPKGVSTVPVDVKPAKSGITVVDVTPPRIDVTIEDSRSKEVPVRVIPIGSPQQGFAVTGQSSVPPAATVTGAASLVALTDSVVAEVQLTGLRVDFTGSVELKPRDVRNGEIGRVTVNPARAQVTVDIEQRETSVQLAVNPPITGQPASGYNVAGVTTDPLLVTVTGPEDVLQSIDAVKGLPTEEVSVADARGDVVRTVQVILPEGARVSGGTSTVKVTVSVRPSRGEASFQVVPQVRNVATGLVVVGAEPVTVVLAGDVPVLDTLAPESITVVAEAQGLGPGLYSVPMTVTPPAGTTVVRTEPTELNFALAPRS